MYSSGCQVYLNQNRGEMGELLVWITMNQGICRIIEVIDCWQCETEVFKVD